MAVSDSLRSLLNYERFSAATNDERRISRNWIIELLTNAEWLNSPELN
jgi:hypothetical protein